MHNNFLLATTLLSALGLMGATPIPNKVNELAVTYANSASTIKAVAIIDGEDAKKIESIGGTSATVHSLFSVMMYTDFPDPLADVKIKDTKPVIYVVMNQSPKGRVFLAKAESQPKKNKRSVKMGKVRMFGTSEIGVPDPDWTVAYDFEETKPTIWKLIPKDALKIGEYGIFAPSSSQSEGGDFFGFSIEE